MLNYFYQKRSKKSSNEKQIINHDLYPKSTLGVDIIRDDSSQASFENKPPEQLEEQAHLNVVPEADSKTIRISSESNHEKNTEKVKNETPRAGKNYWLPFMMGTRKKKEANLTANSRPGASKSEASANQPQPSVHDAVIINYSTPVDESIEAALLNNETKDKDVVENLQNVEPSRDFNNKIFSFTPDLRRCLEDFTLMLKDIVNGVPIAIKDLESLLDRLGTHIDGLNERLPEPIKKIIAKAPSIMKDSLSPFKSNAKTGKSGSPDESASKGPVNILLELVTKNGLIISLLKRIMNILKMFPPAVMSSEVLMPMAIFLLMVILWYSHKRGKEERLRKGKSSERPENDEDSHRTVDVK